MNQYNQVTNEMRPNTVSCPHYTLNDQLPGMWFIATYTERNEGTIIIITPPAGLLNRTEQRHIGGARRT